MSAEDEIKAILKQAIAEGDEDTAHKLMDKLDAMKSKSDQSANSNKFGETPSSFKGMTEQGNIDLTKRPQVKNEDGSISTVRSIGVNIDGQEVLIPTVVGNRVVSDQEAINHYLKTGEHLGKFSSPEASDAYAQKLHEKQADMYLPQDRAQAQAEHDQAMQEQKAANAKFNIMDKLGDAANAVGGFVRGAGSIGATIARPFETAQENQDRRDQLNTTLHGMGYSPESTSFKVGKVASEIAGTAPLGGLIAAPLKAIPIAAPLADAIATGGMSSEGATGMAGIATRVLGGGINGAAQTAVIDPNLKNIETGTATGALLPQVLKPLGATAGALYRATKGAIDDTTDAGKLAIYAIQNKLPLLTSDVFQPNTLFTKAVQGMAENIPYVGTGATRAEQAKARDALAKELSHSQGVPSPDEVVESLKRVKDGATAKAADNYKSIIGKMGNAEIPLTSTVNAIDSNIEKLTKAGAVGDDATVKVLQNIKDRITAAPNDLELLRNNRTTMRTQFLNSNGQLTDVGDKAFNDVYNGMTKDMHAGVVDQLGDDYSNLMRNTDAAWREGVDQARQTKLRGIFNKPEIAPDLAEKMIKNTTGQAELNILHNSLDDEGRKNARAIIFQQAIGDNAENSANTFVNKLQGGLNRQVNTFFQGDDKKALQGAMDYLNATRRAPDAITRTSNGKELLVPGMAAATYFAHSPIVGGVLAAFAVGSRAYESPQVRNLLIRAASIPKNSTQFEKVTNRITDMLAKNAPAATVEATQ